MKCEEGHIFKAELPLDKMHEDGVCIHCKTTTDETIPATSEQIQGLGFTKDDYT